MVTAGVKVIASLVEAHLYSPGEADQDEEYPRHLVEIIDAYAKLMGQAEYTATPMLHPRITTCRKTS